MHHQSKERNMSKSQKKKKKLARAFPFGLARFRFNEVRINEVPLYNVIDEKVVAFVNLLRNRTKPLPVTLSTVREYAEQVKKDLGEKNFRASSGWWEKVYDCMEKLVMLTIRKSRRRSLIPKILEKYDPEHIYNWNETGLYFRLISNTTYTANDKVKRHTRGTKAQKAKDRLMLKNNLYQCYWDSQNSSSYDWHPRCFRTKQCPLPYKEQKNAWNDCALTKWWFHEVLLSEERTSQKIALIADNFGSHDANDKALQDPQVEWIFLQDETSYLLTTVYAKCHDLKQDKI